MTYINYCWENLDWFFENPETFIPVFSIGKVRERAVPVQNLVTVENADCEPP